MTNAPYYIPGGRYGLKYGHGEMLDGLIKDGLWDVYNNVHMVRQGHHLKFWQLNFFNARHFCHPPMC